jgi:ABC-2 type transport system ATP-binding protein
MAPTTADPAAPKVPAPAGGAVLHVEGVEKAFGAGPPWRRRRVAVLRGASLEVRPGELVGLVGENGSGKSVLMQIIVGMLARDAGTVQRPARLGYCPQLPLLYDKLTVAEHFDLFATAYGMREADGRAAATSLMDELQFGRYAGYRVEDLSGGTRQKLNLALALLHDPQLLLLDEPYAGFDWETYLRFWEMAERRRSEGMGILVVSHLLAERDRLTRIYELRDGRAQAL